MKLRPGEPGASRDRDGERRLDEALASLRRAASRQATPDLTHLILHRVHEQRPFRGRRRQGWAMLARAAAAACIAGLLVAVAALSLAGPAPELGPLARGTPGTPLRDLVTSAEAHAARWLPGAGGLSAESGGSALSTLDGRWASAPLGVDASGERPLMLGDGPRAGRDATRSSGAASTPVFVDVPASPARGEAVQLGGSLAERLAVLARVPAMPAMPVMAGLPMAAARWTAGTLAARDPAAWRALAVPGDDFDRLEAALSGRGPGEDAPR